MAEGGSRVSYGRGAGDEPRLRVVAWNASAIFSADGVAIAVPSGRTTSENRHGNLWKSVPLDDTARSTDVVMTNPDPF